MRLYNYINEEYLMRVKNRFGEGSFNIFVNPSKKDLKELKKYIRFLASAKTKKLYVWNSQDLIHMEVWKALKKENLEKSKKQYDEIPYIMPGYAINSGEKLRYDKDDSSIYIRKSKCKYDWKWIDKHLKGFSEALEGRFGVI